MNVAGKMARRAQQHLRAAGHLSIIHRYARLRKRSGRFDDGFGRAFFDFSSLKRVLAAG
ncbi:hypothetical protein VSR68_23390 [Paraburkholderia phymatum]|uniref:hypothetical protein n=1 Tax=Paraburkholderia phymatum TaxID=148447 RepID=UPI00316D04AF